MFWKQISIFLRVLFFVRVPIFVLAALIVLAAAAATFAKQYVGGLFNFQGDALGLFLVAWASELVSLSVITSANTVIHCGPFRLGLPNSFVNEFPDKGFLAIFLVGQLPALAIYAAAAIETRGSILGSIGLGLSGWIAGLIFAIAARLLQLRSRTPGPVHPQTGLVLGRYEVNLLGGLYSKAYRVPTIPNPLSPLVQWFYGVITPFSAGYFRPKVPGDDRLYLRNSHVFAAWLFGFSLVLYFVPGALHESYLRAGKLFPITSLFYVLLFLMLVSWFFSAVTFFFDRYRVPVLLLLAIFFVVSGSDRQADHYFAVEDRDSTTFVDPEEVLNRFAANGRVPILIATAGGGIQAAAWTTQVIDGLQDRFTADRLPQDFVHSVALVSAVSGGSVGAMHFGFNLNNPRAALCKAKESSLDDVAWAWINPDTWRAIAPEFRDKMVDRGWALEKSLERIEAGTCGYATPDAGAYLTNWARKAATERFPAFLFNATSADAGSPVVFATTNYPSPTLGINETATEPSLGTGFHELFGRRRDVRVITAVRLSATFPYVSPAARPQAAPSGGWRLL